MEYELVIGLETHVELSTKTKIFCSCSTKFGGTPNSHCCPVCIGLPGTLPKLNKAVVEYAVKAGLSTNCKIANVSKMDRKNYVYPDLAKAYQISQYDHPLCYDGYVGLSDGSTVRINRIHIEEDAGKLIHEDGNIFIDYNRGGVPLIEIVTEPDFHSAEQVRDYVERLRLLMKYIGVSDCKMQEGSMRCDVNISIRPKGEKNFGTRTEIKNMNSITHIVKAINAEYERQVNCIENNEPIIQQTLRFNEQTNLTEPMRSKEDSDDYRYFREPDLPYVYISDNDILTLKKQLPELFDSKIKRYVEDYKLSLNDATQIAKYANIAIYFEKMVNLTNEPKLCTNVLLTQIFRYMDDDDAKEKCLLPISAEQVSEVISLVASGDISNNFIKKIIDTMFEKGKSFRELFDKNEFSAADNDSIISAIEKVIAENEKAVVDFKSGKDKAIAALIGKTMRELHGKADAKSVENILRDKLK